jgi:TrwC relaxase
VTVSFSKSISVLHASIRENARRARLAGHEQTTAYWAGQEDKFQTVLHRANRAALEYAQQWAGVTRTGYHGTRVDGQEPGRFEEAGLVVTSWLQGTSRDGDPQDHIHNQIARITRTVDGPDVRRMPDGRLWLLRDTYTAETQWAPRHTGRELRLARLGARNAELNATLHYAEAQAARKNNDHDRADRHEHWAASYQAMRDHYRELEDAFANAMDDRHQWEEATWHPRRFAIAADAELRRRHPDGRIDPLR